MTKTVCFAAAAGLVFASPQGAHAQFSFTDESQAMLSRFHQETYEMTVQVERTFQAAFELKPTEENPRVEKRLIEETFGPMQMSFRLVSRPDWGDRATVLHDLINWSANIDEFLRLNEEAQAYYQNAGDPDWVGSLPFSEFMERVRARAEDAAAVLRVLLGARKYEFVDVQYSLADGQPDPDAPVSGEVAFSLAESAYKHDAYEAEYDNTRSYVIKRETLRWTSGPAEAEQLLAFGSEVYAPQYAMVWRFEQEDMERVRDLMAAFEMVRDELTYPLGPNFVSADVERCVRYDDSAFLQSMGVANAAAHLDASFCSAMILGLKEISRLGWLLGTEAPPEGMFEPPIEGFADRLTELELLRFVSQDPPSLPAFDGEVLAAIVMPDSGVTPALLEHVEAGYPYPEEDLLVSDATDEDGVRTIVRNYNFNISWGGGSRGLDVPRPGDLENGRTATIVDTSEGDTSLRYVWEADYQDAHVIANSVGEGDSIDGGYAITIRGDPRGYELGNYYPGTVDAETKYNVHWALKRVPGAPEPPKEGLLELRVVKQEGETFVPVARRIDFAEGIYLEARLEKPATQQSYKAFLEVPNIPFDSQVELVPVEGEPTLLRSKRLYFVWPPQNEEGVDG